MLQTISDPSDLNDQQLAEHIASGDTLAMQVLMRRHNQLLFRAARSVLKDDSEAEETVQDAYLLAFRAMHGFRGESRLGTWLTRIVINEALGRARKNQRRAQIIPLESSGLMNEERESPAIPDASDLNPENSAMRAEARRLVESKIDTLPDAFRSVFVLRALEDMSVEEVAHSLGIEEATVRTRYFRARGMLREALAREIDMSMENAFGFAGHRCDRIVAAVLAQVQASPTSRNSSIPTTPGDQK